MLCGESLFHFWKLAALETDLTSKPKAAVYQQRWHDIEIRHPSWYLQMLLDFRDGEVDSSICNLVDTYHASYCYDPRDRVFALLPLADSASRRAFLPDYTQSVAEIALRLLEYKAKHPVDVEYIFYESNFREVHDVVGAFGLGPDDTDIAAMQKRRRIADRNDEPCSGQAQLRTSTMPKVLYRITMEAESYCEVWQDVTGQYVASLSGSNSRKRNLPVMRREECETTAIRTPNGVVACLTNKQIQPGDTLLFFRGANRSIFHCGLVVRHTKHEGTTPAIATIVGQCLRITNIQVCSNGPSCTCDGHHLMSYSEEKSPWKVHMSPEDLLSFVAQDLKLEHRQPKKFEVPMRDVAVRWDESAERLNTSVTCEALSSYAVFEDVEDKAYESDSQ